MYAKALAHARLGRLGPAGGTWHAAVAFLASPARAISAARTLVVDGAFTRRVN